MAHSEGRLDDLSTMTQVHNTMQTLVFGSHSLVNRIRRAIKARQLVDRKDSGFTRVFSEANTEYTSVPVDWCWAYLTLLNLRNWAAHQDDCGRRPVRHRRQRQHHARGYVTLLPWTWTAGQNNNSGMHSALFVRNDGMRGPKDEPPTRLSSTAPVDEHTT